MLRLVKHYEAPSATPRCEWPEHGPGECVLPFDVSLQQGILEALVASGARGMSSEELQARFSLSSKLMALVLVPLKAGFRVRRSHCCTCREVTPVITGLSSLFVGEKARQTSEWFLNIRSPSGSMFERLAHAAARACVCESSFV